MRRDERVRAALDGYIASDEPGTTHADAMGLALDAALADLGGLNGLELLADLIDVDVPFDERKSVLLTREFYDRLPQNCEPTREGAS